MTAPTINGTKYPQPVDELLPAARKLAAELGELPSRNKLMQTYRIGAPKAGELLARLRDEAERQARTDRMRGHLLARGSSVERVELHPADVDHAADDEPTTDPWDYAEPIGPNPLPTPLVPESAPPAVPNPAPGPEITPADPPAEVSTVSHPGTPTPPAPVKPSRPAVVWPVVLLALPAFVAIWSGWVGLGGLTGFGIVHPLPGIADGFSINTAITLPIGVETYGAYALYVWLSGRVPAPALRFAKWSALGSLLVGALGQVAYHLLVAAGVTSAPWWITTAVACLPVAVLGMGAALAHLVRSHN
ncbi:ABC transporter permease [Micromonospora sp. KC721]|uniref:ABC transporter permease n=1 Tax=Micromonospora sp. KC721 TaxID=2530380 RepID=UPI0010471A8F|nr:ABC transporter permease [Micromonospora sp. KC721]TDB78413.1 ABC transporter permease [Micromonospora sp. KC721]